VKKLKYLKKRKKLDPFNEEWDDNDMSYIFDDYIPSYMNYAIHNIIEVGDILYVNYNNYCESFKNIKSIVKKKTKYGIKLCFDKNIYDSCDFIEDDDMKIYINKIVRNE